jgi:hypothetical protein
MFLKIKRKSNASRGSLLRIFSSWNYWQVYKRCNMVIVHYGNLRRGVQEGDELTCQAGI